MAETQVLGWGTQSAPAERVTKDAERFTLLAVNATFDGTAAASSFLPCVEVISDAGEVVARCPTDSAVAAGGSAEVTFAPFLRGTASSGPAPTTILQEFLADLSGPFGTLVNPGATALAPWSHLGGSTLLDLTTPTVPTYLAAGVYIFDCNFNVVPGGAVTAGTQMSANLTFNDFVIPLGVQQTFVYVVLGVGQNAAAMSITREGFAGVGFQFQYLNGDTTAGHTANFQLTSTVTKIA